MGVDRPLQAVPNAVEEINEWWAHFTRDHSSESWEVAEPRSSVGEDMGVEPSGMHVKFGGHAPGAQRGRGDVRIP